MSTIAAPPVPQTTSRLSARLSVAFSGLFLLILVGLHLVKSELDPSWRMISEYEIGRHGWLMQTAFLVLAVSTAAAAVSVRRAVVGRAGKVGLVLLAVAAAGMVLGGLAVSDPITATAQETTTHGSLHGLGAMLGIPAFPVAAGLVARGLSRGTGWAGPSRTLWFATVGTWLGLAQMVLAMAVLLPANDGAFGPGAPIGLPNRLLIVSYVAWLLVVTVPAARTATGRLRTQGPA
ncbi:MAG TPA: DUF998 domain-containing protein [Nocardioidaceae bacterium]|nr:DUF998 domain-containing protein [Nocardioidaceae bacterium]